MSHGVNIDHNIKHLGTPLYVACEHQQVDCAKKLLESGNINKVILFHVVTVLCACSTLVLKHLIVFWAWPKNLGPSFSKRGLFCWLPEARSSPQTNLI